MAIDSAQKRKSIAAISLYAIGPVVVPDGTIGQPDRQVIGYSYSGIAAGGAPTITAGPYYYLHLLAGASMAWLLWMVGR